MGTLLHVLKDRGDDQGVVNVYEATLGETEIGESEVIREFYAVSLNKVGRVEDSIDELKQLSETQGASVGEVAGILGKTYKIKSEVAKSQGDKDLAAEYMTQSIEALRKGFYDTYEFYPGINLVYNQLKLAKLKGEPALVGQAFNDAELVTLAVRKAGGEGTADYWTAATLLEAEVFSGELKPNTIKHCLSTARNDWELDATIKSLSDAGNSIGEQLLRDDLDDAMRNRLERIRHSIAGVDGVVAVLAAGANRLANEGAALDTSELNQGYGDTEKFLNTGFMYGETTTLIGGNIQYGGQLQSHVVNRFDVNVAYAVIEHYGVDNVESISEFNTIIDVTLREQFQTAELEDLHSDAHHIYDAQIKNLLDALGINDSVDKRLVDSRTNVMVDFLMGRGDCRQHAHAKQLIFDSWKTMRLNNLIDALRNAREDADATQPEIVRLEIENLLNTRMMVFDSTVESKVKMKGLYDPIKTEDGEYIVSENYEAVEDHTWNGIVRFQDGEISSFEMADSFYQQEYGFGGRGQLVDSPATYINGEGMVVTELVATTPSGDYVHVPVRLKPTVYSVSRAKRMQTHSDTGSAHFRGIDLGDDVPDIARVIDSAHIAEFWRLIAVR